MKQIQFFLLSVFAFSTAACVGGTENNMPQGDKNNLNFFGKEIATGYAGNYQLDCKAYVGSNTIRKKRVLRIDSQGKTWLDGMLIFADGQVGEAQLTSTPSNQEDNLVFFPPANSENISAVYTQEFEGLNPKLLVQYKNPANQRSDECKIALKQPRYISKNIAKILKNRAPKGLGLNVRCSDSRDGLNKTYLKTLNILKDGNIKIGSASYLANKLPSSSIRIIAKKNAFSTTKDWTYDYSLEIPIKGSYNTSYNVGFKMNKYNRLITATLADFDTNQDLTCELR